MNIKFILMTVLVLTIIGCTPQEVPEEDIYDADVIVPAEKPIPEIIEEPALPAPEPQTIIMIEESGFVPTNLATGAGNSVTWKVNDNRKHVIACYSLGKRIAISDVINQGETFTHKFDLRGEIKCVDAIYGLRGSIIIEPATINAITGQVVAEGMSTKPPLGFSILIIAMLITALQIAAIYKK